MTIFVVIPLLEDPASLGETVEEHIGASDRYRLQADAGWLIKFDGTTTELSHKLEITDQPKDTVARVQSAIVLPIGGSYYGRGPADMWEWLKTRMEA
jgi:hypothetical protein